ncbi:hypothetical protein SUGI_0226220 [Cryptomeria japonica]|uniref:uncharacterized protein LOC131037333 n=1 Tax=Cryptomeria japonica TaxID=3369 RepID=UPI002408958A|nr:uncharacterized protein LOC131037333 [Cryptomeria japonica]GLJ14106.1 hypothetical protein SUGI_0226220 [Cryptomeria japonica]
MDDPPSRRSVTPVAVGRHGSHLTSGELNQEARTARYSTRFGGSIRVPAIKSNGIEDKEQGQSSKTDARPSSSKPLSQKSDLPVPKLGSSSTAKLRKAYKVSSNSSGSGQSNSIGNMPIGLGQLRHVGQIFQMGGAGNSSRLGLAEISNLTSSEGSNSEFEFRQDSQAFPTIRSPFDRSSNIERKEPRVISSRCLNRLGSWNESESRNVNRRLSDLIYEDDQQVWIGKVENGSTELGVGPTSSLASSFVNDAPCPSIISETDHENTSDDSFATVSSMAGDLFDVDAGSSSDSLLHYSPLTNERSQEQGNLRRGVVGQVNSTPVSLDEEINISRPSVSKRKTSFLRTASQVAGKSSSQESSTTVCGSGSKEKYVGMPSVGGSRRNFGKFGCTSASDAIPSNGSSSNSRFSEHSGNRRTDSGRRVTDGRDSVRSQHKGKVPVVGNTVSPVSQRTIRNGLGVGPHHQASSTPRTSRRTVRAPQPDAWGSHEIIGGDTVMESRLSSESGTSSMRALESNAMLGNRHRARSPSSTGGRSALGALQRRHDVSNGLACTLGERVANRLNVTTRRGTSNSVAGVHLSGPGGSSSRPNSICTDSGSSSYSLLREDEAGSNLSIISGPAPSRAPPLPPVAQTIRQQTISCPSTGLPFSGPTPLRVAPLLHSSGSSSLASSSSPSFCDGTAFVRSASGSDALLERSMVSHPEINGRRAFRALSIESDRRTQHTMEGLAEVLLALERIEQDEDLTYEQVLMLEANLLFGGINLHDQHSDMRLDIDNMSYEELLALEDRIGSVSTGLTEETISRCMKRVIFSSDAAVADLNTVESEVKCSVCQEEYEEGDELGRLSCDHSYHSPCIKQWLLQKNLCPICKAPASS